MRKAKYKKATFIGIILIGVFFHKIFILNAAPDKAGKELGKNENREPSIEESNFANDQNKRIIIITDGEQIAKLLGLSAGAIDGKKIKEKEKKPRAKTSKALPPEKEFSKLFSWKNIKNKVSEKWNVVKQVSGLKLWKLVFLFFGILFTFLIAKFVRWLIEQYLHKAFAAKTKTDIDDLVCKALGKPAAMIVVSIGLYCSVLPFLISFPKPIYLICGKIAVAAAASAVAWGLYRMINVINRMLEKIAQRTDNTLDDLIVAIIRKSLKVFLVLTSVLFIGQNILGLNITTLLAGAGVAGLAIAFAAQNTVANFFGSIIITLDRPFTVGQRVVIDGKDGVIEEVGFRSTKLRTLDGHLVTIPNKNIADLVVENISKRPFIKLINNFTLVYDTPVDKMERAIEILHEIYDNHEGMNEELPPKIFFNSFNDWALNIMVVVWYHPGDYWAFQEWNHKTNLEILRRFNEEGIEFAFPTNTTYLAYDPNRKLEFSVSGNTEEK